MMSQMRCICASVILSGSKVVQGLAVHAAEERMQKLYQRSMFHLLRVDGQLTPALQAKVTVVEVILLIPALNSQQLSCSKCSRD